MTSNVDQAAACGPLITYLGGTVVGTYLDPGVSGYRRDRPGLKRLLADIRAGKIDIVVSEALDRLARDGEDVAWLGKKLQFDRVRIHTTSEGEIDDVKLAVAAMLGALFLSQLKTKTIRGMEAAVLAGRFAGGLAYGYKRVIRLDARGELMRGLLEIEPTSANIVTRIYREFAAGLSAIQIVTRLNQESVPGPRGAQWNASTIRGDPKKAVGILNNPLYRGQLVWKRREWRRNPDSDRRERRYRLRDASEWISVALPDLRIMPEELEERVRAQLEHRAGPTIAGTPQDRRGAKHLLYGLIRCGICGSRYVISGKDYYRCAAQKERGTCTNTLSVCKGPLETANLVVLHHDLLTDEHAQLFIEEFKRETMRLANNEEVHDIASAERLTEVDREFSNLKQNLLAGVISLTLIALLADREAEKLKLEARRPAKARPQPEVEMLPTAALLDRFRDKVAKLRESLDYEAVRPEAAGSPPGSSRA